MALSKRGMTRRTFVKSAAFATAATAIGVSMKSELEHAENAYADELDSYEEIHTCCRGCISRCGLIACMRNGRVVKMKGDPLDPMNQGRICPKGLAFPQALYHPNRNKYPMKRVGPKPGNQWERVSWDEASMLVAKAMVNMRDSTGRHGLLATTGGGGNPQFFGPIRFRNFWGGGNVFEPGCAQCYLPRFYTQPLVNGINDNSLADMNCLDLYNPHHNTDVYVMWGTVPAWDSPCSAGRAVAELRAKGTKTVVIDPRFTPDASKADVWLPIRPGTDVAMMLGWFNYIIEHDLYKTKGYEDFAEKWTNLPFLVDSRDSLKGFDGLDSTAGKLLRATEVFSELDPKTEEGYLYYDKKTGKVQRAFALGPKNEKDYNPELFGTYKVKLANGKTIECKTAAQVYKDVSAPFTLEKTAEICGVEPDDIVKAIELYASSPHGGITCGVATDQYPQANQAALGTAALDCFTGHISHAGCPVNQVADGNPVSSLLFGAEIMGPSPYTFQQPEAIAERYGYSDHKFLGGWQHSHIPTTLNAALTGEPYPPKVWVERSGNKMAALANVTSWLDAIPNFDMVAHAFMYPTSFTTEAADVIFPTAEWLECNFIQQRCNVLNIQRPVTNLFEAAEEIIVWARISKACAELGDENMKASFDQKKVGDMVPANFETIDDYQDWSATVAGYKNWKEACDNLPKKLVPDDEYWASNPNDSFYTSVGKDGLYSGFGQKCEAGDITNSSRKCGPYGDILLYQGRNGIEMFPVEPASVDYSPVPYYVEPEDYRDYKDEYPLVLTNGRIPMFHHGTLRNVPYLREMYPVPEVWINPEDAKKYGIEDGEWVNLKSPRSDGKDVFCNLKTGEPLTAESQKVAQDGIEGIAWVTKAIGPGTLYMERYWYPELLEDGSDGRRSWTTSNVNLLTKNSGYYGPEYGTYTLRGINVKVSKGKKPDGIWTEPEQFEAWMPVYSENTGGGCRR